MDYENTVGIIPAGGYATRISPIPCSKEIFPIDFHNENKENKKAPKVVSSFLIDNMKTAGADKFYFILRPGKWDIPAYYTDGSSFGINVSYLMVEKPFGVPFTVNQASPFINEETVLFGFPDIIIEPKNAFSQLKKELLNTNCQVMLGLFPVENPSKWDMVDCDTSGNVLSIEIKPQKTKLKYAWSIACWNKDFTRFIKNYCESNEKSMAPKNYNELYMGDCITEAIKEGLNVKSYKFESGKSIDIGTPEDLIKVMKYNLSEM